MGLNWPSVFGTILANWNRGGKLFVTICTTRGVDIANTGMDKPTDSPGTEPNDDPLLTEKDACAYLRVSKRNLYDWRMAGQVPYFKIGRAVRFRRSEVDVALERMRMG